FKNIEQAFKTPQKFFSSKEVPKITIGYVPKTDELLHEKGFDHPEYIKEILNIDQYLGNLLNFLDSVGYNDTTAIGIVSDHGNYKAQQVGDLEPFFRSNGLTPYDPKTGKGDFDANFGCVGSFNFPGKTWHHHPKINDMKKFNPMATSKTIDLFDILWKIPGVKLMYYRDDNNTPEEGKIYVKKKNKKGQISSALIEYKGMGTELKTKYIIEDGEIFGYSNDEKSTELIDGKFHLIDNWLSKTYDIDFPIIIDQIPRYFMNPRSSDIVVSTLGEYSYNYEHGKTMSDHLYSHDIALKNTMTVPFIIGGAEAIPREEIEYCKTTDLVPTILELLGINPHKSVVGNNLII
ncbi:MAG: hypothetical protein GF317_05195, partial [Candidatus Lokiarchaeota archaeon]|nr:hypothetical protein [Candidatus Lokiarchaeota archaeon]MBD3199202.1 hypothetical protein [Candidatus Lokiarchaeota archaeon]